MKKSLPLFILILLVSWQIIQSFTVPKFYHGRIFLDETRFSESWLSTADVIVAGGTKHFSVSGYRGRFEFTELIIQGYQNFDKGFFVHAYIPFCSVKINDIERQNHATPPLAHCIRIMDIYDPGIFAGWTLNYEHTNYLDYLDVTFELGALINTPKNSIDIPLFPIGYTRRPGCAAAAYCALGAYEWLTLGCYTQAIVFPPATIWSAGSYIKFDHIIPKISCILALCGDGQNKNIESIHPWQMLSVYLSFEADLATDERPWLPRFKALYSKPVAGYNTLRSALGGLSVGVDAQIVF